MARKRRILHRAAVLFAITATTTSTNVATHGAVGLPLLDPLPGVFGLVGEDVDTAILFELWCELWLIWAVLLGLSLLWWLRRRDARLPPPSPWH